jgi:hypothetical protein
MASLGGRNDDLRQQFRLGGSEVRGYGAILEINRES